MSSNNFGVGVPFVFDGQNYQTWAIKMKAYLRGLDLWDVVETGTDHPPLRNNPTEAQMKHHAEECTKKFKSLSIIHAAVTETIFTRIMACETGKEAWDKLRDEFQGSEKTKQMQVLNLRREFELLGMKESESVKEYVDRLMKTVNQIRLFGEYLPERRVIEKVLVSLAEKFETKLSSLEDSRDLSQLTPAELINSLQAVEQRKAYRLEEPSESTFVANQKGKTQATSAGKKPAGEKKDKEKKVWEGMTHRQVQINTKIKHKEKMQVGPFFVSEMEDARDLHLIQYIFDLSCESCTIVSSPHSFLKQPEFNTLKPQTQLDSLVIDIFADILTYNERKKNTMPLNWYLPVTFSTAAISGDVSSFVNFVERQKIRENYMSDLIYCEKMFIPVHIKKGSLRHFYLYIIHLKNGEVEIWDSLFDQFINKQERDETTQKLLDALNELFKDVIWSPGWAFTKFHLKMADNILLQSNGYDCGIFVVNFMQQSANYVNRNLSSFQFDSDEERLDLTLKLLKSELNKERETLYEKAVERHNAEGGNEEDLDVSGSKRKRDDSCKIFSSVDVGEDKSNDDLEKDAGKGIMRGIGGRPKAEVWEHVRVLEGLNKVECNYCGFRFARSANRIKSHLGLIERNGIKPCPQYHQANTDFTKRVKGDSDTTSSNLGKNPINSKGIEHLKMSTAPIIPKLTDLQSLYLNCFSKSMDVSAQDLQGLKELEGISASFCDIKEFSAYVRNIFARDHVPQNYRFTVTKSKLSHDFIGETSEPAISQKLVVLERLDWGNGTAVLPEDIKELYIFNCRQLPRCLCHGLSFRINNNNPCKIGWFSISSCDELEYLCCFSPNCPFCSSVPLVDCLRLDFLEDLQNIVEPRVAPPSHLTTLFSHLRYLEVFGCDSMKTLLTPALAAQLRSLETISVDHCESMKEIVSYGSDLSGMILPSSVYHFDHAISLPKLNSMTLTDLPELNCVYRGIMLCPSFKSLVIRRCEKLTRPPQIQPAPQIEKIPGGYLSEN